MLGRYHHIGGAEQRIAARGINEQTLRAVFEPEPDLRALAAANPVDLLGLDLVQIIHLVQIVNEALGVLGNLQHPLGAHHAHDLAAAALAYAVHHFLIGKAHLAARTEIDGNLRLVGEPLLVEL